MTVRDINEFERHFSGTFNGVKSSARSTKPAFTSEGNSFDLPAMLTTIDSTAVAVVTAMNHFFDILINNVAYFYVFGFKVMEVILENQL